MLRELLRHQGWSVAETTDSLRVALEMINFGEANMIIIDDLPDQPSSFILRQIFMDRIGCLTPTVVFSSVGLVPARTAMSRIGLAGVVVKPHTPDKFLPVFLDVISQWSKDPYAKIRHATAQLARMQVESGLRALTALTSHPEAQPIVAPCVARYLFDNGNIKAAEKILLESLRVSPRNLGIILSLAEIYLKSGMPEMAYKILNGVRRTYQNSLALMPDLLMACLMLDQLELAISLLKNMAEQGYFVRNSADFLARCLIAEGRTAELLKLGLGKTYLRELETHWDEPIFTNAVAS